MINEEGERCRLPFILPCGHGICYDCIMKKKNVVADKICCLVCKECHPISKLENTLRDPLYAANFSQMGLVCVKQLERQSKGDYLHYDKGTIFKM